MRAPPSNFSRPQVYCVQLEAARTSRPDLPATCPQSQDFAQNPEWTPLDLSKVTCPGLLLIRCVLP